MLKSALSTQFKPGLFKRVQAALEARSYVKLILGASFTDHAHIEALVSAYCHSGIQMIDMAADVSVIDAVASVLAKENLLDQIALMISFPLDADPHFRKITFEETACIDCEACIPTCPTTVFSMKDEHLALDVPLCYGCGRCLPACPTNALSLEPFAVMKGLQAALTHPAVSAVEVHSTFADVALVETMYAEIGEWLDDKLLSLCFRPQLFSLAQNIAFVEAFQSRVRQSTFHAPFIVQVDGQPMSATQEIEASLPALNAAEVFAATLAPNSGVYVTISGGINAHTATYLQQPEYCAIQGVGLGTAARTQVWKSLQAVNSPQLARELAENLISPFLQFEQ